MQAVSRMPAPRRKPKAEYIVGTIAEVAEFFGVGTSAVNAWRRDANPMPGTPGRFDLAEIAKWKDGRGRQASGLREVLIAADVRLKTAQAEQKEFDLRKETGQFVELAAVELWAAQTFITLRECLMSLPDVIATSAPAEIRTLAREEADRIVRATLTTARRRLDMQSLESELSDEPNNEERNDPE